MQAAKKASRNIAEINIHRIGTDTAPFHSDLNAGLVSLEAGNSTFDVYTLRPFVAGSLDPLRNLVY